MKAIIISMLLLSLCHCVYASNAMEKAEITKEEWIQTKLDILSLDYKVENQCFMSCRYKEASNSVNCHIFRTKLKEIKEHTEIAKEKLNLIIEKSRITPKPSINITEEIRKF
ncbi:MAG: hypothetical protein HQK52_22205 [Oligoflexia bacterium]|nr:hypothetical protein [Oligoflexia bacterium]